MCKRHIMVKSIYHNCGLGGIKKCSRSTNQDKLVLKLMLEPRFNNYDLGIHKIIWELWSVYVKTFHEEL